MPSIIPGFEYDIFISYRHNDNRSGWVTDFVQNLKEELAATIKDPLSVYFDTNPHDGLLETHNVDKSLEGKLKCLIFIPVLSQTYCDPKSFAWQNEFTTFNKLARADAFGRDVKLANRNVAGRILPMKIHDLDHEDTALLESELGGAVRSIEFIYKSVGVNRPLNSFDNPDKNLNKTIYRDQINKVANAIKEIVYAIKFPDRVSESPVRGEGEKKEIPAGETGSFTKPIPGDNSLAVLPFVSLTQDSTQEYFADGIMENILIQLAGLRRLRVISRTSVMRYKKTTKSAPEIAAELGVKYILEGSAQSHGNKVRIHVQLIDAQTDNHVWGKVFMESLDDIFTIQNSVAEIVARELNTSLLPKENEKLKEIPTKNLRAYDLFLKGRHAFNLFNVEGYRTAEKYFKQALEEDPDFTQAYSYLANTYSALMSWNGDLSPEESYKKINLYLPEVLKRGATDIDYLTKAYVEFFISKDFASAEKWILKAMEIGPNNDNVLYAYSYVLNMMGRASEALQYVEKAKAIDPTGVSGFNFQGICLYLLGRHEEATATFREVLQLYPNALRIYDHLARVYLTTRNFQEAANTIVIGLKTSNMRPPSMIAYLAAAYVGLQQKEKALPLLDELLQRSKQGEKGVNIYIVHVYNALGDMAAALTWMDKAVVTNDIDLVWRQVDPLLKNLNQFSPANSGAGSPAQNSPDYDGAEKFITRKLQEELPGTLHYHNTDHIRDVLQSALKIAESENISEEEIHLLRLAALFHDSGIIYSHKEHEKKGCELATDILPSFHLTADQIQVICGMIMATRIPQSPKTLLEKIICDADLDYLGRDDFYSIGSKLQEEMKDGGLIETEREWNLIQKTFLQSHQYHTRYAQENREALKKQHLDEIVASLRKPQG